MQLQQLQQLAGVVAGGKAATSEQRLHSAQQAVPGGSAPQQQVCWHAYSRAREACAC